MKVILGTGSRYYPIEDKGIVYRAVANAIQDLWTPEDPEIEVRHGDCPTGADSYINEFINIAQRSLRARGILVHLDKHPADWKKYGSFAGPKRNKEMVDLGADIGLVFPCKGAENKGTFGTRKLMKEAGIPYTEFWSIHTSH